MDLNVPQLSSLSPNIFEDIDLDINQLPFEIEPEVVLKSSPEVTIKKLQEPIQSWLRNANERFSKPNIHVVENEQN